MKFERFGMGFSDNAQPRFLDGLVVKECQLKQLDRQKPLNTMFTTLIDNQTISDSEK